MTRLRTLAVTAAAALSLTLTGCGIPERIVHLQDAPTVEQTGAPLRHDAAERIAARVLGEAAAAADQEQRAALIVQPAKRLADYRSARGTGPSSDDAAVVVPDAPRVLAMTKGSDWPRAMLVTTLEPESQVQSLHVLVSTGPAERYKLHASASMFGGTAIPSLGDLTAGTEFEASTEDSPIEASTMVTEYAKGLAFPTPGEASGVSHEDAFAQSLARNAKAQNSSLDDLGKLTQAHSVVPGSVVSMATADGSRIVFGQLVRTDTITLTDKAKELKIQDPTLRKLLGDKEIVKENVTVITLENLLFLQPASGEARLIGAEELVARAEGA